MTERKSGKAITIYDIASEAGVSPATVSRVMSKSAGVSEEKRRVVNQLVKKYNFRPNALAQSLSNTRTSILGLVVADIRNPFFAALAVEIEKEANRRGYSVLLCNALNDNEMEDRILEKLYEQRAEAIIQAGSRADWQVTDPAYAARVNRISETVPFVTTGKVDGANCLQLNIDDAKGMQIVIDYLVSLGHQRIALFGGTKKMMPTYAKYQQYIYLMGKHGLTFREEYIQEGDYSSQAGYDCMNRLLSLDEMPTAVIAVNDFTAAGALKAASQRGVRIPEDLSVISFDNTFLSQNSVPRLTTVDYDYSQFGAELVDIAVRAIEHRDVPRRQYVTPKLIVRDSCAPV